jgi:hypothetical protein
MAERRKDLPVDDDIRHQLDMDEVGPDRGDDVLHSHGRPTDTRHPDTDIRSVDEMLHNYQMDMSEESREGDEMSGDDHSSGLQGGDPDLTGQPHISSGLPGERTQDEEKILDEIDRHRAS